MARTKTAPKITRRITAVGLLAGLLALGSGCAATGHHGSSNRSGSSPGVTQAVSGVYADPASAALAAFQHLRGSMGRSDQRRLHVGSIVRVEGGYAWLPPIRAPKVARPIVQLKIDRRHVATFAVHPRSGRIVVDRANNVITEAERRVVDEVDPLHRPLFVLAPSGRMLGYTHGGRVATLADLGRGDVREPARVGHQLAYEPAAN